MSTCAAAQLPSKTDYRRHYSSPVSFHSAFVTLDVVEMCLIAQKSRAAWKFQKQCSFSLNCLTSASQQVRSLNLLLNRNYTICRLHYSLNLSLLLYRLPPCHSLLYARTHTKRACSQCRSFLFVQLMGVLSLTELAASVLLFLAAYSIFLVQLPVLNFPCT